MEAATPPPGHSEALGVTRLLAELQGVRKSLKPRQRRELARLEEAVREKLVQLERELHARRGYGLRIEQLRQEIQLAEEELAQLSAQVSPGQADPFQAESARSSSHDGGGSSRSANITCTAWCNGNGAQPTVQQRMAGEPPASASGTWGARLLGPRSMPRSASMCPPSDVHLHIDAIPEACQWDAEMCERMRTQRGSDVTLLQRQYLRGMAVLLPSAQLLGPGSDPARVIELNFRRCSTIFLRIMDLNPQAWCERSHYHAETLELLEHPSKDWLLTIFYANFSPSEYAPLLVAWRQEKTLSGQLRQEERQLLQQYSQATAQYMGLHCRLIDGGRKANEERREQYEQYKDTLARHSSGSLQRCASPHDSEPSMPSTGRRRIFTSVEEALDAMDGIAALLEKNLMKQRNLSKRLWTNAAHLNITRMVSTALCLYPVSIGGIDFLLEVLPELEQQHGSKFPGLSQGRDPSQPGQDPC